jgi:signal transduction histidine kinase/ActR/RegA family two-component response regulator
MDHIGTRTTAARAYYGLLIASLLLPLLVFVGGSRLAWNATLRDAHTQLTRALLASSEHAAAVLNTQSLVAAQVSGLLLGLDDAAISVRSAALRDDIHDMIRRFPELSDVTVINGEGHTLLSASGYPIERGFAAGARHALQAAGMPRFIGATPTDPLTGGSSVVVGLRRGQRAAASAGGILVSADAESLVAPDHEPAGRTGGYMTTLVLTNGRILARDPASRFTVQKREPSSLQQRGVADDLSGTGIQRLMASGDRGSLVAYRKLDEYPIYVIVGRSRDAIIAAWRDVMETYLIVGIAATIALCALSILAARRAQREAASLSALQEEVRRREVAEEALRQAQKMEAVGRLTSGIAHDFNNHLTVVSSNIELLMRRLPREADPLARLAEAAMQGVQRAASLTHRLLAFSRQQPLDPEPLDLGRLVGGMADLLRTTLGATIALDIAVAGRLWLTRVDANQVESAVLHLAVNARDAMPEGGRVSIEVGNAHLDQDDADRHVGASPGDFVTIAVADTGAGMPPDAVAKAFERFFTNTPPGKGSGSGLSMVRGFVRRFGGYATIASEPGRGTTVTLYLPRHVQDDATAMDPAGPGAAAPKSPGKHGAETVLVVEDDDAVRRPAVAALRETGYQVLEAPDAMEAIRLIADRGGIDLLFTDIGLPGGVDGRALADAARAASATIRVLFTTGFARQTVEDACNAGSDVYFLAKPFTLQELAAKVREVLDASAPVRAEPVRSEAV